MKTLKKFFKIVALLCIAFYLILLAGMFFYQEKFIFHPFGENSAPPADLQIEEVYFDASDSVKLHGWFMDNHAEKTVLLFHGNAGNLSIWNDKLYFIRDLGFNALIFDYRGFGKSAGEISEESDLYEDGKAAYLFLKNQKKLENEDLIFWGVSMGNAPSIEVAQNKNLHAVVIESAFVSLTEVSKEHYPIFPIESLLKYHYANSEKIPEISAPILVIHSVEDNLIPFHHAQENFQKIQHSNKQFLKIHGDHNNGWHQSEREYVRGVSRFLRKISGKNKKKNTEKNTKKSEYFTQKDSKNTRFSVVKISGKNVPFLASFYQNEKGEKLKSFYAVEKFLGKKLEFVTNGGIFSKSFQPLGLYIEKGKEIVPLNTSPAGWGNFSLKPNGVFFVKNKKPFIQNTEDFQKISQPDFSEISLAVQSGPLLLDHGKMHPAFQKNSQNLYVRNGVGIDDDGNVFFVLSHQPVNFYDFASFFQKNLGCHSALYLDGAISQMEVASHRIEYFGDFSVMLGVVAE